MGSKDGQKRRISLKRKKQITNNKEVTRETPVVRKKKRFYRKNKMKSEVT